MGDGRTSIWLHPAIPLVYKFYGSRLPVINSTWIRTVERSANTNAGLHLIDEPMPADTESRPG